jgi:Tfp pilus assembly protein PilF
LSLPSAPPAERNLHLSLWAAGLVVLAALVLLIRAYSSDEKEPAGAEAEPAAEATAPASAPRRAVPARVPPPVPVPVAVPVPAVAPAPPAASAATASSQPQVSDDSSGPPEVRIAPPPTGRSITPTWFEGSDGFLRAKQEQKDTQASLLMFFETGKCPDCRLLESGFGGPNVEPFLAGVLKVRVSPDRSAADRELARSMEVRGFPSVLVIAKPDARPVKVRALSRDSGQQGLEFSDTGTVAALKAAGVRPRLDHLGRAHDKLRANDLDGARAELDKAVEANPQSADALYWRAIVRRKAGALGDAARDLEKAIEHHPKRPEAHAELTNLAATRKDYDRAIEHATRLIQVAPAWADAAGHVMRAHAYRQKGEAEMARADYQSACKHGNKTACSHAEAGK